MNQRSSLLLACLCGLAAAPALAQNALDRNLQRGSGGINPSRPDFAQELAFRNAVVTGNAPGGMSFRGDVGYRAPGEFFGRLGSNETYAFRRDSVYSGLGGMGLRGTDALQYQFALTTGNTPPPNYSGLPIVPRSGTAATGATVQEQPYRSALGGALPAEFGPRTRAGDPTGPEARGALDLRSTSAYATSRSLQPSLIGTMRGEDGEQIGLTASSLRGIGFTPIERQRIETGVPQPPEGRDGERPPREGQQPTGTDRRINERVDTTVDARRNPYEQVLDRMRGSPVPGTEPALPATGYESDLQRRLTDLRSEFSTNLRKGVVERSMRGDEQPAPPDRPDLAATPGQPEAEPGRGPGEGPREFDPETLDMLRRSGHVDNLAPEGFDAYSNAMRTGQQLLAAARYFDAEARFTSALGARPGDPMAAAGRVHAELGAGMFLSAALNLRALLTQNPEIVGVKYAAELLPAPDRIPAIKNRLREMLANPDRQDPELGMLLAYLGYQTDDRAALEDGLKVMGQARGDQPDLQRLSELLRQVWTRPAVEPTSPASGPGAGATAPPPGPNPPPNK